MAFGDQVEGGVVVVFGFLAGVVGHAIQILRHQLISRTQSVILPVRPVSSVVNVLKAFSAHSAFSALNGFLYHVPMRYMLRFLWNATRGHRLTPWRSPYLLWRIETYCGVKMQQIGFLEFWEFTWRERKPCGAF